VQSLLAVFLPLRDFVFFLLAGSAVPDDRQDHKRRVREVVDAKRRVRAQLDPLLRSFFRFPLLDDASGFLLCWNPDRLAMDAFLRLHYNVDTAWRDDVALLAAQRGVPESGLLRVWNPAIADPDVLASFAFVEEHYAGAMLLRSAGNFDLRQPLRVPGLRSHGSPMSLRTVDVFCVAARYHQIDVLLVALTSLPDSDQSSDAAEPEEPLDDALSVGSAESRTSFHRAAAVHSFVITDSSSDAD
ncbi:UVR8, partial [Symbiodinium sp. CCMP2456]